jgi:peroxiredoxin
MKLASSQQARDFEVADFYGNQVSLKKLRGQKIHLTFYRFSGCPNCNLRFHRIEALANLYKANNTVSVAVFESSAEHMKAQIAGDSFYAIMVPDEKGDLYKLYDLGRSKSKLLYYLFFKGGLAEFQEGKKLFRQKVEADGHADRLEAEFLIDENGKAVLAHYNNRQGEFLPVDTIMSLIRDS